MRRMRTIAFVLLLAVGVSLLSGCTSKGAVATVIYSHVGSLRRGTVRASTELWTDSAKANGRQMAEVFARFTIPRPTGAKIAAMNIEKDTATVTAVWYYSHNVRPETYIYLLEKTKRKWKIAGCTPITQPLE